MNRITMFVVGFNFLLAIGLGFAAWRVWRSRRDLRRFAIDLTALEAELAQSLAIAPLMLDRSQLELQVLRTRQQQLSQQLVLMQQLVGALLWVYRYRSRAIDHSARSTPLSRSQRNRRDQS